MKRPSQNPDQSALACELAHPIPIAAVCLLVLNDHFLKAAGFMPGWLTGKLSDFAGLFFFPVLLFVLLDSMSRLLPRAHSRRLMATVATASTAVVFGGLKLSLWVNMLANEHWGTVVLDASDLIALPMGVFAWWWIAGREWSAPHNSPPRAGLRQLIVLVACAASLGTSPTAISRRNYPTWEILKFGEYKATMGCAKLEPWVSKSGKTGVGVTLALTARPGKPCPVQLTKASLVVDSQVISADLLLEPSKVGAETSFVYLPFVFDNEAAWNRGVRSAKLQLEMTSNAQTSNLQLNMVHRWDGPHRSEPFMPSTAPTRANNAATPATLRSTGNATK